MTERPQTVDLLLVGVFALAVLLTLLWPDAGGAFSAVAIVALLCCVPVVVIRRRRTAAIPAPGWPVRAERYDDSELED